MAYSSMSDAEMLEEWKRLQAIELRGFDVDANEPAIIELIHFTLLNMERLTVLAEFGVGRASGEVDGDGISCVGSATPGLDFTTLIDQAVERLRAAGSAPAALSMSMHRRTQLASVLAKRGDHIKNGYNGLPIQRALDRQQMVAVIDSDGKAHLV